MPEIRTTPNKQITAHMLNLWPTCLTHEFDLWPFNSQTDIYKPSCVMGKWSVIELAWLRQELAEHLMM